MVTTNIFKKKKCSVLQKEIPIIIMGRKKEQSNFLWSFHLPQESRLIFGVYFLYLPFVSLNLLGIWQLIYYNSDSTSLPQ